VIIEAGHYALILALFVALTQSILPLVGAARGNVGWMAVGRSAALTQFGLIATVMAVLM
jgi:cytochrome c-type biogenesis protein CcmF